MLSITLNNVVTELQENREKIKILTENNKALPLLKLIPYLTI